MCEVFISADPQSYESRTRSVRLHGVVTSIRLENLFWQVLEEIAGRDGMGVVQLIERLYDELVIARGEVGNFASFLRVSALRYEALLAQGAHPGRHRDRHPFARPTGRAARPAGGLGQPAASHDELTRRLSGSVRWAPG